MVRVRRSKTDQLGEGADVAIPFGSQPEVCPVRAVEVWCEAAGVQEGVLLRSVDWHGRVGGRLDGRDVARSLKVLAARAGLGPSRRSGHSLRVGLATTALAGRSDRAIMAQGQWQGGVLKIA